jgi:hypothetical protein
MGELGASRRELARPHADGRRTQQNGGFQHAREGKTLAPRAEACAPAADRIADGNAPRPPSVTEKMRAAAKVGDDLGFACPDVIIPDVMFVRLSSGALIPAQEHIARDQPA